MSRTIQLNTRVDEQTAQRLAVLAQATGRSKTRLFHDAITAYLANELAFLQAIEHGRTAIREGRFTDWDAVEEELDALFVDETER
jgi:predicted transcriptional regulator